MEVNVKGKGVISFPDTMSREEVIDILAKKFPKREDYGVKALQAIERLLDKKPVPAVIEKPVDRVVEKQVIVEKPVEKVIEKPVVVEKQVKARGWTFYIERDEDGQIEAVMAEPK